jgi:hypothetical protein
MPNLPRILKVSITRKQPEWCGDEVDLLVPAVASAPRPFQILDVPSMNWETSLTLSRLEFESHSIAL